MSNEFLRGLWIVAYRELLRMAGSPSRMIFSFFMPIMFLVIFGAGFGRSMGTMAPGVNFLQFLFPGIVAQTIFMGSVMSGVSVVMDREFGFMRELLVAPISRLGIICGKVLGTTLTTMVQTIIILVIAPFVKVSITFAVLVKLIPLVFIMSLAISSLGILLAVRMRSQQTFQLLMPIIFPLIYLAGVFFPLNNVPTWLAVVSKMNPLTYCVDAIRHAFLDGAATAAGGTPSMLGIEVFGHHMSLMDDAMIMVAMGVVLLTISAAAFSRQP